MFKTRANIPFNPSRLPFFYGWVVLTAGTIGMLMSVPGQTVGVSAFTEDLLRDLAVNRDNLSLAYLVGTVFSGLMITRAGKLYDKHGARVMAFFAGLLLGIMLLYLTRVSQIAGKMQQVEWISPSLATFVLLSIGFWGIRFFGQGMLTMVSRNMVMKWFDKRRGMANAVLGIFTAFGFSLAPQVLSQIIAELEWRGAWVAMAVAAGVIFTVFVLIIYRDNPESCGLNPDGRIKAVRKRNRPASLPDRAFTLSEARRTLPFWAFTLALSLAAMYVTGVTFHVISIFQTGGMQEQKALSIFVPTSFVAVALQFGFSYISDFVKLKNLLLFFVFGMALSSVGLLMLAGKPCGYILLIAGNGIIWGLYAVLIGVTWPRFFGLKHLGAISGFSLSWTVIGSAMGPYLFSLSMKHNGNYNSIAIVTLVLSFLLFLFSFKANNPSASASDVRIPE